MSGMIPFIDLAAQRQRLGSAIDDAVMRVVNDGNYIMGPDVKRLEAELAVFTGAKHVVSCANGTDALLLALMAKGVKPRDAVLVPSFTFAATAEAVAALGATPLFIDVLENTFSMDIVSLEKGIETARKLRLNPVGTIPVDLFGLPADYDPIVSICEREGLWILCDAAQSFGATYKGRKVGTIGLATSTSFFPAKPLGCYGDGGAIFTDDEELANVMRSLRIHGQGTDKYDNVRVGMNARLDTMQAAILIEKLRIFPDELEARSRIAARYNDALRDVVLVPELPEGLTSAWAQFTIKLSNSNRNAFQLRLQAAGIPSAVYYRRPLHQQTAYSHYPVSGTGLKVSERLSAVVLSLPMHPYLSDAVQDQIVSAVREAVDTQHPIAAE